MSIYPIELSKLYAEYREEYQHAFASVLEKGIFIGGKEVEAFEHDAAEYLGADFVIGCGNGTHALELAMMANRIGPGDEVIVVANTYYATARAIVDVGAEPVFCDVNQYGLMDVSKAEKLISEKTKAILPVHLYGAPADLDSLEALCKEHGLCLIEDCAHAFGSTYKGRKIGAGSHCACFSLYPTKNLGAMGDAGMIAVRSREIANKIRDIRYYTSDAERIEFHARSLHSRLDTLQAAMLRVSLKHVDKWNQRRVRNAQKLIRQIEGKVPFVESVGWEGVVPYVFPVLAGNQARFIQYLKDRGITAQVHYRPDLHKITHLTNKEYYLPQTEALNRSVVSVPISSTVSEIEVQYIGKCIIRAFEESGNGFV